MIWRGDLHGRRPPLAALSDAMPEAAPEQMGIAHADIPRIVFRDLFSG